MPTYEYECQGCGHQLEAEQSMKDAPLTDCPSCSTPKLTRLISGGAGFIMKGANSKGINIPASNAPDWKIENHMKEVQHLMNEPTSESELVAAAEQGAKHDKDHGFEAGHAMGGRKPVLSMGESKDTPEGKAKMSAAKAKWKDKIAKSQAARSKIK